MKTAEVDLHDFIPAIFTAGYSRGQLNGRGRWC
jgi:hypothetical protein